MSSHCHIYIYMYKLDPSGRVHRSLERSSFCRSSSHPPPHPGREALGHCKSSASSSCGKHSGPKQPVQVGRVYEKVGGKKDDLWLRNDIGSVGSWFSHFPGWKFLISQRRTMEPFGSGCSDTTGSTLEPRVQTGSLNRVQSGSNWNPLST